MQFSKNNNLTTSCDIFILCLRVFTNLSKPNNVRFVSTASAYATSTYRPKCRPK